MRTFKRSGECSRRVFDSVSHRCRRHRHQHSWGRPVAFETTRCRLASLLDPISERPRRRQYESDPSNWGRGFPAGGTASSRAQSTVPHPKNQQERVLIFFDTPLTTDIFCVMAEARLLIPRNKAATVVSLANSDSRGTYTAPNSKSRSAGSYLGRVKPF